MKNRTYKYLRILYTYLLSYTVTKLKLGSFLDNKKNILYIDESKFFLEITLILIFLMINRFWMLWRKNSFSSLLHSLYDENNCKCTKHRYLRYKSKVCKKSGCFYTFKIHWNDSLFFMRIVIWNIWSEYNKWTKATLHRSNIFCEIKLI